LPIGQGDPWCSRPDHCHAPDQDAFAPVGLQTLHQENLHRNHMQKPLFVTQPYLPPLQEFIPYLETIRDCGHLGHARTHPSAKGIDTFRHAAACGAES